MGVVVIREHLARFPQHRTCGVELCNQVLHMRGIVEIDVAGIRIRRVFASEDVEPLHDLRRFVQDGPAAFMRGGDDEPFAFGNRTEFFSGNRPHAADLDGGVADFTHALERCGIIGGSLAEVPQGVELDGDLIQFHDWE